MTRKEALRWAALAVPLACAADYPTSFNCGVSVSDHLWSGGTWASDVSASWSLTIANTYWSLLYPGYDYSEYLGYVESSAEAWGQIPNSECGLQVNAGGSGPTIYLRAYEESLDQNWGVTAASPYPRIDLNMYHLAGATSNEKLGLVAHEVGHALGINDCDDLDGTDAVMYPWSTATGPNANDDIYGFQSYHGTP